MKGFIFGIIEGQLEGIRKSIEKEEERFVVSKKASSILSEMSSILDEINDKNNARVQKTVGDLLTVAKEKLTKKEYLYIIEALYDDYKNIDVIWEAFNAEDKSFSEIFEDEYNDDEDDDSYDIINNSLSRLSKLLEDDSSCGDDKGDGDDFGDDSGDDVEDVILDVFNNAFEGIKESIDLLTKPDKSGKVKKKEIANYLSLLIKVCQDAPTELLKSYLEWFTIEYPDIDIFKDTYNKFCSM